MANTIDEKQELDKINQSIQQRKKNWPRISKNKKTSGKLILEKEIELEVKYASNQKITETENQIAVAEADLQEAEENVAKMDEICPPRPFMTWPG